MQTAWQPANETCTLEAALGRLGFCPAASCPLWDDATDACVLHLVRAELVERPSVAGHVLGLRDALEAASVEPHDDERSNFFCRLNLENVHDGGAS